MHFKVHFREVTRVLLLLCILPFLMGSGYLTENNAPIKTKNQTDAFPFKTYLPIVQSGNFPIMTGIYPSDVIKQSVIDNEVKPLDNWVSGTTGGHSTTIIGTFIDMLVDDTNAKEKVETPLTIAWNNGYVTFINFPAPTTAFDLASGHYDAQLTAWAKSYKNFALNGQRFSYLAPLQEMNGDWVSYGKDPGNFKIAFKHIQDIFNQVGVPKQSVKWVFAPNGWGNPSFPRFEDYYPGDAYVDVVAISAYNWGYCRGAKWEEPDTVFNNPGLGTKYGHYLDRLRAMAPSKPIFIAETASSSYKQLGKSNYAEKDRWLKDAYTYLSNQPGVKGVLYFNTNKECDWLMYSKNGSQFQGYRTGVIVNGYRYIVPNQLMWFNPSLP